MFNVRCSRAPLAADNGTLFMWDWRSGHNFQRSQAPVQPGSIDSEAGVFALAFDRSGSRLLTAEADKTIKMYREDPNAVRSIPFFTRPLPFLPSFHCTYGTSFCVYIHLFSLTLTRILKLNVFSFVRLLYMYSCILILYYGLLNTPLHLSSTYQIGRAHV